MLRGSRGFLLQIDACVPSGIVAYMSGQRRTNMLTRVGIRGSASVDADRAEVRTPFV